MGMYDNTIYSFVTNKGTFVDFVSEGAYQTDITLPQEVINKVEKILNEEIVRKASFGGNDFKEIARISGWVVSIYKPVQKTNKMPDFNSLYKIEENFDETLDELIKLMKNISPNRNKTVYIDLDVFKKKVTLDTGLFCDWFNAQNNGWKMRIETNVKDENFVEIKYIG